MREGAGGGARPAALSAECGRQRGQQGDPECLPIPRNPVAVPHPGAVHGSPASAPCLACAPGAAFLVPWAPTASAAQPPVAAALLTALHAAACLRQIVRVSVHARQHLEGAHVLCVHSQGHHAHLGGPPVLDHHGETEHQGVPVTHPHHQWRPAGHGHQVVLRHVGACQCPCCHTVLLASEYVLQKGITRVKDPPSPAAEQLGLPRCLLHDPRGSLVDL